MVSLSTKVKLPSPRATLTLAGLFDSELARHAVNGMGFPAAVNLNSNSREQATQIGYHQF
jgi:hypothetical protein